MTNTTEKQIPYKMVQNIYRIRWSIELVFKTWKSILKIHKSNVKVNQYRVKVELYAKLILAVITHKVYQKNIAILAKDNKELSLHKLTDLFERNKLLIKYQALISTTKFAKIMKELTDIAMKTCIKKYQESRKTSFQIVNEKFEGYIYVP